MIDNKNEKADYFKLLGSGMFWEIYPELTGEWEKDKEEFNRKEQWLDENFRNNMDAIGSKKHKIPTTTMNEVNKRFEPLQKIENVIMEPRQELSPIQVIERKVTPILVLYLNVLGQESISDALDYALISLQTTFKESGWAYLILPITDGRDSFIESHSVERLDPIELKQLETKILETIKTGE